MSATNGQYALITDLRAFQIDVSSGKAIAEIEIFAKLINVSSGKVLADQELQCAGAGERPTRRTMRSPR